MNDRCAEHLATLLRVIDRGEEIPPDVKSHLSTCAECARLLDAMHRVQADLERDDSNVVEETVVTATVAKSDAEVRRSRRIRNVLRAIAVAVTLVAGFWVLQFGVSSPGEGLAVVGIAFLTIAPAFVVIALLLTLRERFHEPGKAIYKRLKPGRQLDGVCLGLSEATGIQVLLLRVVFFALLFAHGSGLWLYILFSLLMPIHPDDRQYLLRFQLARAIRRLRGREVNETH